MINFVIVCHEIYTQIHLLYAPDYTHWQQQKRTIISHSVSMDSANRFFIHKFLKSCYWIVYVVVWVT